MSDNTNQLLVSRTALHANEKSVTFSSTAFEHGIRPYRVNKAYGATLTYVKMIGRIVFFCGNLSDSFCVHQLLCKRLTEIT
jgi:hypothetical protein